MIVFHENSYPIQSTPKYINPNRICQLPESFRVDSKHNLTRQKSVTNTVATAAAATTALTIVSKQPENTREILNRIEDHWIPLPLPPPPPQLPQFARRNIPRPPLNPRHTNSLPKNENKLLKRSATTNISGGGVYPLCTFDILTRKNKEFENKTQLPQPPPQIPPTKPPKQLPSRPLPNQQQQQQQQQLIKQKEFENSRSSKSLSFHPQKSVETSPSNPPNTIIRRQPLNMMNMINMLNYPRIQNQSESSILKSMQHRNQNGHQAIYSATVANQQNQQMIIEKKQTQTAVRYNIDKQQLNHNHHHHHHNHRQHHLKMSPSLAEFTSLQSLARQMSFDSSPSSSFERSNSRFDCCTNVDANLNSQRTQQLNNNNNKRFLPISTIFRTLPRWFFESELVKNHRYMSKYVMY